MPQSYAARMAKLTDVSTLPERLAAQRVRTFHRVVLQPPSNCCLAKWVIDRGTVAELLQKVVSSGFGRAREERPRLVESHQSV